MNCESCSCMGVTGVPEIPERPTIRERPRGVEVKWTGVVAASPGGGNNDSGPLVYIVDSRWNIGREQSEADMTPWQQVAQVGSHESTLLISCSLAEIQNENHSQCL